MYYTKYCQDRGAFYSELARTETDAVFCKRYQERASAFYEAARLAMLGVAH